MGYGLWVMGYGVWDMGYWVWFLGYGLWVLGQRLGFDGTSSEVAPRKLVALELGYGVWGGVMGHALCVMGEG